MTGQIPMKAIAANTGKKHKKHKTDIDRTVQKKTIGLVDHSHRTNGNEQVTVNNKPF